MEKSKHIQEIIKHREKWVQAVWADQALDTKALQTTHGQSIQIKFPGWLNKGAGPDFKEACIRIDDVDHFGAVEIHCTSSLWHTHQHHRDPAYNGVVLHVVLDHDSKNPVKREDGKKIPELVLRPHLKKKVLPLLGDETELLDHYDYLPGKCGIHAHDWTMESLKRLVGHAAERRIQQKVDRILEHWGVVSPEQHLFQLIFKAFGYSSFSNTFEELSQLYPYDSLIPVFKQPFRVAKSKILARWLGSCGLLDKTSLQLENPTLRKEYYLWQDEWNRTKEPQRVAEAFSKRYRPQNAPERRIIGMFYHLNHLWRQGLLKGWLNVLRQLESIASEKQLRSEALKHTSELFSTPTWEEWQTHFSWENLKAGKTNPDKTNCQFIGKDRQLILWANVIIPFFLALSRKEQWVDLEKLLYRLFIVFPPEAANHKTQFMEKRLLPFPHMSLAPKTMRLQQGLIQIYQDFCQNFSEGCNNCRFIQFLDQYQQTES